MDQGEIIDSGSDPTHELSLCEGDCDDDSDCAKGLVCLQRDEDKIVPGCKGNPIGGWDYCIQVSLLLKRMSSP